MGDFKLLEAWTEEPAFPFFSPPYFHVFSRFGSERQRVQHCWQPCSGQGECCLIYNLRMTQSFFIFVEVGVSILIKGY